MMRCLGVHPGSVCAFGLINDMEPLNPDPKELFENGHRVKCYIDKDLKFLDIWGGEVEWLEI